MNWASCSTSRVESSTKLLASFWDSCAKQPVPVRLAGHQTPPLNWARLPVYAACSWGHVVNVPHFLGGLWKKKHANYQKWRRFDEFPRHFQLANDIHKRPWSSCRAGNCPWESEPKLPVVYSEQIYSIWYSGWLTCNNIYIYMQKHERKISVVKIYEYSYSRLSLG